MPREPAATLGELGRRVNAVEQEMDELRELVDGQESWSHRRRLHALEDDKRAAELVHQALDELHALRRGKLALVPQWGSFVVAAVALAIALTIKVHGG